jgi:hypothetical protein
MRAWLVGLALWIGGAAGQIEQAKPIGCAEALRYVEAVALAKSTGLSREQTLATLGGSLAEYSLLLDEASLRLRLSLMQTLVEMA